MYRDHPRKILWLRYLLQDLKVPCNLVARLFSDNQVALHIGANPVFHEHTKHIEIDCYTVREKLQVRIINPSYVPTGPARRYFYEDKEHFLTLRPKLGFMIFTYTNLRGILKK